MQLKQMIFGAAVAAALGFGAASAFANSDADYPLVPLTISGTVNYTLNNDAKVQNVPLKKLNFTTASLIALLNASASVMTDIHNYATYHGNGTTGVATQIPTGSYFVWNPYAGTLNITNANGFFMPGSQFLAYNICTLNAGDDHLCGTYNLAANGSGTETDVTGIDFSFNDQNNNIIDLSGTAILTWTYGAVSAGNQKVTLSVTMTGSGDDGSEIDDIDHAVASLFSASGTGTKLGFPATDVPFFYTF